MKVIVLMGEVSPSWNGFYAGKHWKERTAEVNRVRQVVRCALNGDETPYTVPVDILVVAYFAHHPLDSDNIPAKLYVDALKDWLLQDDDIGWVRRTATESRIDKTNPRVEIQITEAS